MLIGYILPPEGMAKRATEDIKIAQTKTDFQEIKYEFKNYIPGK